MNKHKVTIEINEDDELLNKEVKKFGGNSGHIIVSPKHIGKKAIVITNDGDKRK